MRPFPLRAGVAEVLGAEQLTPRTRRLTLGGADLAGLPVDEPGEIVTLLWPAPGRELVLPERGWRFPPGVADTQHARNYTARRWDTVAGELTVDLVVHGDHGLASRWGATARPGDTVGFAGPRVHWVARPQCAWSLLVADETGLPALAAIAEELPAGHRAIAVVEVADADEELELRTACDLELRWLHRDGAPAGTTTLLRDAVRELALPAGPGCAWGGGEARAMRDVRRHLRDERALDACDVRLLGYWKLRDADPWD